MIIPKNIYVDLDHGSESMNLTEVASHAIAADQADIGDSWTFELTIDFPGVAAEDSEDLKVEIFGLDSNSTGGVFGFHMCQGKTYTIFLSAAYLLLVSFSSLRSQWKKLAP